MKDERGSGILEYLIAGLIFFVVIFTIPLLIHGAQDYGAMANAERVAMHQEEVDGYYSACASMRLRDALQGANLPANLVSVVSATSQQQQYGQPVNLAVRYVYQPFSWLSIPLRVGDEAVSQYTPGETSGGGCPPPANGTVATGPGSPATVTIHASPNPANAGQQVTFSGEVLDQYGNPVSTNVTVSGGGESATVYAQGGYYSAVLTFGSPGTFTVWATAGGASTNVQETVNQPAQILFDQRIFYGPNSIDEGVIPGFVLDANHAIVLHLTDFSTPSQAGGGYSGAWVDDLSRPTWSSHVDVGYGTSWAWLGGRAAAYLYGEKAFNYTGPSTPSGGSTTATIAVVPSGNGIVSYYAPSYVSASQAVQGVGMTQYPAITIDAMQVGDTFTLHFESTHTVGNLSGWVKMELVSLP